MGAIIPEGFAQVLQRMRLGGADRDYLVTYGVSLESGASVAMANSLHSAFALNWDDVLSDSYTMPGCIVREGTGSGDPITWESTNSAIVGAITSGVFPPNTAVLVKKTTASGGRRNRGRMFIPAVISEAGVNNSGQIDPAFLAARQTIADDFLDDTIGVTGVGNMVILHSEAPSTPTTVTSLIVDQTVATQRRRLRS